MSEMVKKFDDLFIHERKSWEMANTQNTSGQGTSGSGSSSGTQGNSARFDVIKKAVEFIGALAAILLILYGIVEKVIVPISKNEEDIGTLYSNIGEIKDGLDDLDNSLNDLAKFVYLNNSSSDKSSNNLYAVPIKFVDGYELKMNLVNDVNVIFDPIWTSPDVKVATALTNDAIEYTSGELQDKDIVTMYSEGEKEIYFLGKYNKNNCWDGECTLNVYKNNELVTIFEGEYDDGNLKKYKRISCDQKGQWTVASRTDYDEYTDGETWNYHKTKSFSQKINAEEFGKSEILTVDDILENLDEKLISYYNGKTSGGYYNDDTGDAYLVKYDDSGNVRYLYKGIMKDGYGNDSRNDADSWAFIWGDANDGYHYHKGKFEDSHPRKTGKDWQYPKDQDFINSIINPDDFNCPLTGLIEE